MTSGSFESKVDRNDTSALYTLAETMCGITGGFDRYDYAKCVWLGSPGRQSRLAGDHPWPTRSHNRQRYVYSVPVLASVNPESGTLLYVGKDNWKPVDDPKGWLVAERNLLHGEEIEHTVLGVSVDAAHDLRIALAPAGFSNFPPLMRQALVNRPAYAQTVLSGRLDEQYNLERATLREGMEGSTKFEDIEALESMIIFVQQLRSAQEAVVLEREYTRQLTLGLGTRGVAGTTLAAA